MMKTPLWLAAACGLFLVACATAGNEETVTDAQFGSFKKIHELDGIYLASQPTEDDLREARDDHGLKTVVNIRLPEEMTDIDEEAQAESLGLDYVNIPFRGPETLTDGVFEEYRTVLGDQTRHPLLLH